MGVPDEGFEFVAVTRERCADRRETVEERHVVGRRDGKIIGETRRSGAASTHRDKPLGDLSGAPREVFAAMLLVAEHLSQALSRVGEAQNFTIGVDGRARLGEFVATLTEALSPVPLFGDLFHRRACRTRRLECRVSGRGGAGGARSQRRRLSDEVVESGLIGGP